MVLVGRKNHVDIKIEPSPNIHSRCKRAAYQIDA
ncbi:hypothetical protein Egran_04730 [Elaphomyces granulatus]|uniref:Uncharacterized protein n=1 Tax=Elaphomyces granulatus TaxID=519963 RepID=A0A232LTR9_9EURO|nr:hypothetical protein Egran_04730 [Elaphomyces granulatus]